MKKLNQVQTKAPQESNQESNNVLSAMELDDEALSLISGGVPCGYLGTYDYIRKMSYANRNYSC